MLVVASVGAVIFNTNNANAAQITNRSLTLQAGATDGGSLPGGVVNHKFDFTLPGGTDIASIKFEYCTTASVATCVMPTGLVTTSATLGDEQGVTGWTMVNTTNGAPYLTKATAAAASGIVSYRLDTITNPTAVNGESFFVRISTHTTTDATLAPVDTGSVTAATVRAIVLTGTMPESLIFCTGATIGVTGGGIPDCSSATAGNITFDQLFSPTDTATAKSQMAASTNAAQGYIITVNGETLASGVNEIDAIGGTAAAIAVGTGQFGMNLIANTATYDNQGTPALLGTAVTPAADGGDLRGQPTTNYGTDNQFAFASGNTVARSDFNTLGPTNAQIYTVNYIVNVPGNQIAGTYTTTLTYICTPTF